jgi:hypothetical protein
MSSPSTRYIVLTLILLRCSALAPAQSGGGFDLSWNALTGGGSASTGGGFELGGSISPPAGQSDPVMSGGAFQLVGGFWSIAAAACTCPGDMNADGLRDGRDAQQFAACIIAGGSCNCADVDGVPGLDSGDVAAFVTDLLNGTSCS